MSSATTHIQTEKQLVPELRFKEFEGDWNSDNLGGYCSSISSGKSSSKDSGEYPVFGSTGVIATTNNYTHEGENILVARVGANAGLINRVDGKYGVTDNTLAVILKDNLNVRFCESFLIKFNLNRLIFGSGQPLITGGLLKGIKIQFPPLPEQQKIASFLSAVDEKIQQLTKKMELLEQYKKGVMHQLFSGQLRFKDENGNPYPEWEEKRLSDVSLIKKGEQLNKIELTENGLYPSLSGGMGPSGYTNKWNTPENTITISEGGNSCGYVGLSISKFWCGGHCYSLLEVIESVYNSYLFQVLKYNEQRIMRLRVGSGLPNIQMKDLSVFNLDFPCLEEQQKIATYLSSIDTKIEAVNKQITQTQTFKKGLLQQMFV